MKRTRYQAGSLEKQARRRGPDVWYLRYRDDDGRERRQMLGTVKDLPTKSHANRVADAFRTQLNDQRSFTYFGTLMDRYIAEGLPARRGTARGYESVLKRVRERWGQMRVDDMQVLDIERWLDGLMTIPKSERDNSRPLAKNTIRNVKMLMHRIWQCGIRWGVIQGANRIALVEIRHMRRPRPRVRLVLTPGEFRAIAEDPAMPPNARAMVNIAGRLGLRASEILGLRWEDFADDLSSVWIKRAIVRDRLEDTKTPESSALMPVPSALVEVLRAWHKEQEDVNGWLFGSPLTGRPLDRENIMRRHVRPVAKKYGIEDLGWHSFRHTMRSIARDAEIGPEDQRQLMRHTDTRMTMHYGQDDAQRLRRLRDATERISAAINSAEATRACG